jgi:hypothetical protein
MGRDGNPLGLKLGAPMVQNLGARRFLVGRGSRRTSNIAKRLIIERRNVLLHQYVRRAAGYRVDGEAGDWAMQQSFDETKIIATQQTRGSARVSRLAQFWDSSTPAASLKVSSHSGASPHQDLLAPMSTARRVFRPTNRPYAHSPRRPFAVFSPRLRRLKVLRLPKHKCTLPAGTGHRLQTPGE